MQKETPIKDSWTKEFDNEVDRLIAKSLREPTAKPLTELKSFIHSLLSSHEKAYKTELRAKIEGMKKEEPTAIELNKYDHPSAIYASYVGYNKAIDDLIKEIK